MVVPGEMGRQKVRPREVHVSARDHLEDHRNVTRRPRDPDPLGRRPLGKVQALDAERVHRRARLLEVELPAIHLADVGEKVRGDAVIPRDERSQHLEKSLVGQVFGRAMAFHVSSYHGVFAAFHDALCRPIGASWPKNHLARDFVEQRPAQVAPR